MNPYQGNKSLVLFVYEKSFADKIKELTNGKNLSFVPAFLRGFVYSRKIERIEDTYLNNNNVSYYDYSCAKIYGFNIKIDSNIDKSKIQEINKNFILFPIITETFDLEEKYALTVVKIYDDDLLSKWFSLRGYPRIKYADKSVTVDKLYNIIDILRGNPDPKVTLDIFIKAFNIKKAKNEGEAKNKVKKLLFSGDAYLDL